jgi:sulfoxide reductase heme-binding subunit YedZ
MLAAAVTDHLFWITSRAAGTAALLLSSVAVCVGLLFGGKLVKGRPDLRHLHEALSLATIVALVVHAVALLGDNFMSPSLADISIPFVSGYQRGWTTLGIVAGWALIALGLSYYVRDRIGQQRWKKLHRFTALAWIAGIVHSLGEGTDAGATWFLAATGIAVVPALVLLVVRHLGPGSAVTPAPRAAAPGAAPPGTAPHGAAPRPAPQRVASQGAAR